MLNHAELIPRIYQAGLDQTAWNEVMEDIATHVGAASHLAYEASTDGPARVLGQKGFSDDALSALFADYMHCNVWAASDAMVPGSMLLSSTLFPDHRLKQTEYWAGWLRHVDVFYVVGGIVHADSTSRVKLSFTRPESGGGFTAEQQAALQSLVPHFHAAFGGQKRLEQAANLVTPMLHTLDRLAQGVLILRTDGTVVHMNAFARNLLQAQNELRLEGDMLTFRTTALRQRFDAYAKPANAQQAMDDLCFLLPGKPGMPRLQAAIVSLPSDLTGGRHLALFLKEQRTPPAQASALRQLYGLSPAECQLAASLAHGDTLADHARIRGISVHTARSQLKSLSLKMGVSRQSEIVHLVTGLARSWGGPGTE